VVGFTRSPPHDDPHLMSGKPELSAERRARVSSLRRIKVPMKYDFEGDAH